MKILIMEDDPDICDIFKEYLQSQFDVEVTCVASMVELKALLLKEPTFDISFIDFHLKDGEISLSVNHLLDDNRLGKAVFVSASPKKLQEFVPPDRQLKKPFHLAEVDKFIHDCQKNIQTKDTAPLHNTV